MVVEVVYEFQDQQAEKNDFGSKRSFHSLTVKNAVSDSVLLYFIVFAVDLLATSGDITASWTSPIYPKLYSNDTSINPLGRPITSTEDSWIGSIVNVGSLIGAIPAGFLADKFGRKKALLALAIPHITAYITYAYASKLYWFLAARFCSGLSVGAGYALLPMYIAEVTRDANRGAISVTLNVFWAFGCFLPSGIGPYLSVKEFNLILAAIPTIFFIIFYFIGTETPQHLVHQGKYDEAKQCLRKLRSFYDDDEINRELEHIKSTKQENGSIKDIWRDKALRYGFFVSIVLIILNQFSGICAIGYYMQPLFEESGSGLSPDVSAAICGAWFFLSSFSTVFLVERMGRKIPLILSLTGCAVSLGSLGLFFFIKQNSENSNNVSWLPIASILSYYACFNIGLGVIPWTMAAELFPNSVKPITSASVSATCWAASFLVTRFFNILNESISTAGTFWILASFCMFGATFSLFYVPETKGKSFNEIYSLLQKKSSKLYL